MLTVYVLMMNDGPEPGEQPPGHWRIDQQQESRNKRFDWSIMVLGAAVFAALGFGLFLTFTTLRDDSRQDTMAATRIVISVQSKQWQKQKRYLPTIGMKAASVNLTTLLDSNEVDVRQQRRGQSAARIRLTVSSHYIAGFTAPLVVIEHRQGRPIVVKCLEMGQLCSELEAYAVRAGAVNAIR